jgi:hypothetical protein
MTHCTPGRWTQRPTREAGPIDCDRESPAPMVRGGFVGLQRLRLSAGSEAPSITPAAASCLPQSRELSDGKISLWIAADTTETAPPGSKMT